MQCRMLIDAFILPLGRQCRRLDSLWLAWFRNAEVGMENTTADHVSFASRSLVPGNLLLEIDGYQRGSMLT